MMDVAGAAARFSITLERKPYYASHTQYYGQRTSSANREQNRDSRDDAAAAFVRTH